MSDVERSAAWYSDLLGLVQVQSGDDDVVSYRILVHPTNNCMIGLRQYHGHPDGAFDELRTGLDHLAFGVSDRQADALDAGKEHALVAGGAEVDPAVDVAAGDLDRRRAAAEGTSQRDRDRDVRLVEVLNDMVDQAAPRE